MSQVSHKNLEQATNASLIFGHRQREKLEQGTKILLILLRSAAHQHLGRPGKSFVDFVRQAAQESLEQATKVSIDFGVPSGARKSSASPKILVVFGAGGGGGGGGLTKILCRPRKPWCFWRAERCTKTFSKTENFVEIGVPSGAQKSSASHKSLFVFGWPCNAQKS